MEGGAAGQASGDVHSTDGAGVGNPQRDGEGVHSTPRVRRREEPRQLLRHQHLIPSQTKRLTFLPNSWTDIYADLRQPKVSRSIRPHGPLYLRRLHPHGRLHPQGGRTRERRRTAFINADGDLHQALVDDALADIVINTTPHRHRHRHQRRHRQRHRHQRRYRHRGQLHHLPLALHAVPFAAGDLTGPSESEQTPLPNVTIRSVPRVGVARGNVARW